MDFRRAIVLSILLLTVGLVVIYLIVTMPRCLKSHNEPVWIEEQCTYEPFSIGDVTIYIQHCEPAHMGEKFVCDQWEVEDARVERLEGIGSNPTRK